MYTKKKVIETITRLVNLIVISFCFLKEHWYIALMFFIIMLVCFYGFPWLVTLIVLKKEDQKEIDGELYLWTEDSEGKVDYRLTLNSINTIPFKEFLKIRVNENARDESIK
jgi:hypothetical protein